MIVLFAGTKSYEKGIITLIESLKKLWRSGNRVELVSIGPSTREFDYYINKQSIKVRRHVHDLGIVNEDEKKSIFYSCDIVALPSISESFGITYLEAWICKKPVIGCKIGAVRELIEDNQDGILVSFGDRDELAAVLKRLIEDSTMRNSLGENGYKKVISIYDSRKCLSEFEKLCESLI